LTNLQFFKACFDNELKATEALIAALPNDQLSYRPHPVNRSAYEITEHIIAHVADLGIMLHQGKCDEILSYSFDSAADGAEKLSKLWSEVSAILANYSEDRWVNESVELLVAGKPLVTLPRMQMMWFFFFDIIHHRGQLSSYVRPMGGKNPAIYGYSADTMGG
jgi:uncharacterized damage-inducible protein DinB